MKTNNTTNITTVTNNKKNSNYYDTIACNPRALISSYNPIILTAYKRYLLKTSKIDSIGTFANYIETIAPFEFRDDSNKLKYCTINIQPCRSQKYRVSSADGGSIHPMGRVHQISFNISDTNWFSNICSSLQLGDIQTMDGKSIRGCTRENLSAMTSPYSDTLLFFGVMLSQENKMITQVTSVDTINDDGDNDDDDDNNNNNKKSHPFPKLYHGKNDECIRRYLANVQANFVENVCGSLFNALFHIDVDGFPSIDMDTFNNLFVRDLCYQYFSELITEDLLNNPTLLSEYSVSSFREFIEKYGFINNDDSVLLSNYLASVMCSYLCSPLKYTMVKCMGNTFLEIVNACMILQSSGVDHQGVIYEIKKCYIEIFKNLIALQFKQIQMVFDALIGKYGSYTVKQTTFVGSMNYEEISRYYAGFENVISMAETKVNSNGLNLLDIVHHVKSNNIKVDMLHNKPLQQFSGLLSSVVQPYYTRWFYYQKLINDTNVNSNETSGTGGGEKPMINLLFGIGKTVSVKYDRNSYFKSICSLDTSLMLNQNSSHATVTEKMFNDIESYLNLYYCIVYQLELSVDTLERLSLNSDKTTKKNDNDGDNNNDNNNDASIVFREFKSRYNFGDPSEKKHIFMITRQLKNLCLNHQQSIRSGKNNTKQQLIEIMNYMDVYRSFCQLDTTESTANPSIFDVTESGDEENNIRVILNKTYCVDPILNQFGLLLMNNQAPTEFSYASEYRPMYRPEKDNSKSWTNGIHFIIESQ